MLVRIQDQAQDLVLCLYLVQDLELAQPLNRDQARAVAGQLAAAPRMTVVVVLGVVGLTVLYLGFGIPCWRVDPCWCWCWCWWSKGRRGRGGCLAVILARHILRCLHCRPLLLWW